MQWSRHRTAGCKYTGAPASMLIMCRYGPGSNIRGPVLFPTYGQNKGSADLPCLFPDGLCSYSLYKGISSNHIVCSLQSVIQTFDYNSPH